MLNKIQIMILMLIVLTLVSGAASAAVDNRSLGMFGGVGAGYYSLYPTDIQVKDFYSGGVTYKGFLGFKAESGLSVLGELGYYSEGNKSSIAPYGTQLSIIPISASVSYSFFKDSTISPFIGAGLGLYLVKENDPDFVYLQTTKFGKHIFAGADIYFDPNTFLRAELRQTFMDPVNSSLYYQANFGGLTASASIAMQWPSYSDAAPPRTAAVDENRAIVNHIDEINQYYSPYAWDRSVYYPYNNPYAYMNTVYPPPQPSQEQVQQVQQEQQQKRNDYLQQKQDLRQEKKDSVNPAR